MSISTEQPIITFQCTFDRFQLYKANIFSNFEYVHCKYRKKNKAEKRQTRKIKLKTVFEAFRTPLSRMKTIIKCLDNDVRNIETSNNFLQFNCSF